MDAQPKLVRCVERGRTLFSDLITRCDQHLRKGVQTLAVGAVASAGLLLSANAHAQDWTTPAAYPQQPGPVQVAGSIEPAGYFAHQGNYGVDAGYAGYCPPELEAQLYPKQKVFANALVPVEGAVNNIFSGAWFSVDYLYARVNHHGSVALGKPILDTVTNGIDLVDVSDPFPVLFADGITTGNAYVPNTGAVDWKHLNGIRGKFGIPLDERSWLEGTVWGLEEESDSLYAPSIPPTGPILIGLDGEPVVQFIATTITTDGQPGSTVILYDESFQSQFETNFWSSEINYVQDLRIPFDGWKLQAITGYRHEEYSEQLTFGGTFSNISGVLTDGAMITGPLATPQSNLIDSKVHNFRHQAQFGIRSEIKQGWLTVGIEPKIAFGVNEVRTRVDAQNVREPGHPDRGVMDVNGNLLPPEIDDPDSVVTKIRHLRFAPSADLNLYAKADVNRWLRLKIGYNLTWLGELGVADKAFTLNEISDPNSDPVNGPLLPGTADVRAQYSWGRRSISALVVGAEIIFP